MAETRNRHGYPVSPADEIMRAADPEGARLSVQGVRERLDCAWGDGHEVRPPRGSVMGFAVALIMVVALSLVTGCGGKVRTDVDLTREPPVEVRWEREIRALCDGSARERIEAMNRVNNDHLNEMFFLVACPGQDMLNTDAKPLLVNGSPAMGVQVQAIYLLPSLGERVNGGVESDARAVGATPRRPHQTTAPERTAGERIRPTPVGATFVRRGP